MVKGRAALIDEWLRLHGLCFDVVSDCVECIERGHLLFDLDGHASDQGQANNIVFESLETAITMVIIPAFSAVLSIESKSVAGLVNLIRWTNSSKGDLPHTIDHGVGQPPEILMFWQGSTSDLMCLAHEVAHAVQLQFSAGSFMPPIARETCAFLGELALVRWAREADPILAAKLLQVWREENQSYVADDCALLRAAGADPDAAYSYRMNYPLARASAVSMWRAGADLQQLFKAGSDAMALLPLAKIADMAGQIPNYLPPLPPSDPVQPTIDAYRALGAMALLDIDFWRGASERRIEDYYASQLNYLHNRTAFIALDVMRRPVGYATWRKSTGDNTVTLMRQSAPFGDHLLLQKALERHLGQESDVLSSHSSSARQDQVAW